MPRGRMKSLVGTVVGNKMEKTVVVDVVQIKKHSSYQKSIKRNVKFKAHDEKNSCNLGDKVLIVESRPISKTKRWRVSKVLEQTA